MTDIKKSDINFRQQWPLPHMKGMGFGGLLPATKQAAALWNFLSGAMNALGKLPTQTTLEGEDDSNSSIRQIADSVAAIYDVTLEEMFQPMLVELARREATRCELVWNPKLDGWLLAGGKSFDHVTRDPDKVFQ